MGVGHGPVEPQVAGGEDAVDPGRAAGGFGVDGAEQGVCLAAADEHRVERARRLQVVQVRSGAGD